MSDEQQRQIYQTDGDRYEALIAREDHQGNILKAIEEIINPNGLDILDLGAGTGRLTLLLAPRAKSIRAFDISSEMLRVCRERLLASGLSNWKVEVADHRQLPITNYSSDLAVSGWSVSYLAVWNPEKGIGELENWLVEMRRVLRKDGTIILFGWSMSSRHINGWMRTVSKTNGFAPITNLNRWRKPRSCRAFSLGMSWEKKLGRTSGSSCLNVRGCGG